MGIKGRIRSIVKKVYFKLNPQYKYIIWTHDRVNEMHGRVMAGPVGVPSQPAAPAVSGLERDALFLAADTTAYRYLYLLRYIRENDRVLDVEGEYGTGLDLLYKYTPMDRGLCLNSIDYYTRLGGMYHGSDSVRFQTGTVHDVQERFNVITALWERRTRHMGDEDWWRIGELLEHGGILAAALEDDVLPEGPAEAYFRGLGLTVEARLYQAGGSPELSETKRENAAVILYLRKQDEGHTV